MENKNHTMQNVTAVVFTRETEQYHVNYRWTETKAHRVALPVYTGNVSASGKLNKSRNLRNIVPASRTVDMSENVDVTKRVAKQMIRAFDNAGRLGSRENLGYAVIMNIIPAPTKRVVAIGDKSGVTEVAPDFDLIMEDLEIEAAIADDHRHMIGIY